jgi:hypothetical protein
MSDDPKAMRFLDILPKDEPEDTGHPLMPPQGDDSSINPSRIPNGSWLMRMRPGAVDRP